MGEFKFAVPRLGTAQLKKRNTFSIHFYNAGAPTFGGLSPPSSPPPQTPLMVTVHCGCYGAAVQRVSKREKDLYSTFGRITLIVCDTT